MLPLNDLIPRLNPFVPGCPEPMAVQALRDAGVDLCERTSVVRSTIDVALTAAQPQYELDLDLGTDLARILAASIGTSQLTPLDQQLADHLSAGDGAQCGAPRGITASARGVVTLFPAPDSTFADCALHLVVALRPNRSTLSVPDELVLDWPDVVVYGALARLAAIPGQSFTSADMAVYGQTLFMAGVARAGLDASKGRVRSQVRMAGRNFARGAR